MPPVVPTLHPPSRADIALLPPYARLPPERVHVVRELAQREFVMAELARAGAAGFDTETKAVFVARTPPTGPHVVQLATLEHAFIFQVHRADTLGMLKEALESPQLLKVGFGLSSDRGPLQHRLGIHLRGVVDVSRSFRTLGYRQPVGAKAAVAIALGRHLQKSRKATTSNWSLPELSPAQLQYAADDAHAALAVYLALGSQPPGQEKRPRALIL